jgi:hypothetical protein
MHRAQNYFLSLGIKPLEPAPLPYPSWFSWDGGASPADVKKYFFGPGIDQKIILRSWGFKKSQPADFFNWGGVVLFLLNRSNK